MAFDLKTHEGRIAALKQIVETSTISADQIAAVEAAARMCWNEANPNPGVELTEAQEERLAAARKEFTGK